MKAHFLRHVRRRGSAAAAFTVTVLLIAAHPARAQFGGSCGCPVIVTDPQMYGRQGEQLTQETQIADLARRTLSAATPECGNRNSASWAD
jgi:hypothetical protein